MTSIDLNCDMGEIPELCENGTQVSLMRSVSSVSIACGAHAGGAGLMALTARQARESGVVIGAHPGYPDRENFGRVQLSISAADLKRSLIQQLHALAAATPFHFVKPHGALYNAAATDVSLAGTIADAVREFSGDLILVGLAGSAMLGEWSRRGFQVVAEAFADRRYEPDGRLRLRQHPDALLANEEAGEQVQHIVNDGFVIASDGTRVPLHASTICVHSDSPGAAETAAAIRRVLDRSGTSVRPFVTRVQDDLRTQPRG